ncbi:hypothetical protein FRC08_007512 [Ceratobasidium sp. 394]|nr:hypothetical protein FRC08_007512 [Ceratobasidium sp. 394]
MTAAVEEAFRRERAEREASATMALTVFDKLAGSDGLSGGWDERAKINKGQEIRRRKSSRATHHGQITPSDWSVPSQVVY